MPSLGLALIPDSTVKKKRKAKCPGSNCVLNLASRMCPSSASFRQPISFQPAVAYGRLVVPTQTGSLYCLDTGD
jgi:hypothetical protein